MTKPSRRWIATHDDGALVRDRVEVHAISWYLARQQAAIILRVDPDEIAVRPA